VLARHAAVVLALLALPAIAQEPASIRFAHNASAAELVGSVVRGERALYTLEARAGQTLVARITSAEDNAVFQLYIPGARTMQRDGVLSVEGTALPGAAEGDDARAWRGRLPVSGAYLFVVGGARGNVQYQLSVSVR
jgi:hypothetical protein